MKRIIALTLTLLFTVNTVSAAPAVYTITVPKEHGKVIGRYRSDNDVQGALCMVQDNIKQPSTQHSAPSTTKTVVLVQDAHTSLDAQKNIAKIITSLLPQLTQMSTDKQHRLAQIDHQRTSAENNPRLSVPTPFVGIEGAYEEYDLNELRSFPLQEIKETVGEEYVKQGKFIGAELANIISDQDFTLVGLEDKELFKENYLAYRAVAQYEKEITDYFAHIQSTITDLQSTIYNHHLSSFNKKAAAYEHGETSLVEYVSFLTARLKTLGMDIVDYTGLAYFIERLNTNTIDPITDASISDILSDITRANSAIRYALSTTDEERSLILIAERVHLLQRILTLTAVKEDVEKYNADKDGYSIDTIEQAIHRIEQSIVGADLRVRPHPSSSNNVSNSPFPSSGSTHRYSPTFHEILSAAETYYNLADQRDEVLLNNLLTKMDAAGQSIGILVAGGYHAQGITALLQKRGISFVTIMPSIKDIAEQVNFKDRMMGAFGPLDPFFTSRFQWSRFAANVAALYGNNEFKDIFHAAQSDFNLELLYSKNLFRTPEEINGFIASIRAVQTEKAEILAQGLENIQSLITQSLPDSADQLNQKAYADIFMQTFGEKVRTSDGLKSTLSSLLSSEETVQSYLTQTNTHFRNFLGITTESVATTNARSVIVKKMADGSKIPYFVAEAQPEPPTNTIELSSRVDREKIKEIWRRHYGKTAEELTIEYFRGRIMSILNRNNIKLESDILSNRKLLISTSKEIFMEFAQISELSEKWNFLFGPAATYVYSIVKSIAKNIEMNQPISNEQIIDIQNRLRAAAFTIMKEHLPGAHEASEFLLLNHIDKGEVGRITLSNGKVILPSRTHALELTPDEVRECGLEPLVEFLKKAQDRQKIKDVFTQYHSLRFDRANIPTNIKTQHLKEIENKIMDDRMSIDVVFGYSAIGNGALSAHSRRGVSGGNRPHGIWVGELNLQLLRELCDKPVIKSLLETITDEFLRLVLIAISKNRQDETGLEILIDDLIEEGQHWKFLDNTKAPPHGTYKDPTDYDTMIHHDTYWSNLTTILNAYMITDLPILLQSYLEMLKTEFPDFVPAAAFTTKTSNQTNNLELPSIASILESLPQYTTQEKASTSPSQEELFSLLVETHGEENLTPLAQPLALAPIFEAMTNKGTAALHTLENKNPVLVLGDELPHWSIAFITNMINHITGGKVPVYTSLQYKAHQKEQARAAQNEYVLFVGTHKEYMPEKMPIMVSAFLGDPDTSDYKARAFFFDRIFWKMMEVGVLAQETGQTQEVDVPLLFPYKVLTETSKLVLDKIVAALNHRIIEQAA